MTRNEKIAAVLHETRYAETKGSGIRAMREVMVQSNLTPPTFESDRETNTFVVTFLFHHFLNEDDVRWLGRFSDLELSEDEQKALVFAREIGAINNAAYRDINRMETLMASGHLRRLRDLGLLEQKGKSVGTYYVPTERVLSVTPLSIKPSGKRTRGSVDARQNLQSLGTQSTELGRNLQGLPTELADMVRALGQRATPADMQRAVRSLCGWKPLSSEGLSEILGRNQHYLITSVLRPMVRSGQLEYVYPENPVHPQQAYKTSGRDSERTR